MFSFRPRKVPSQRWPGRREKAEKPIPAWAWHTLFQRAWADMRRLGADRSLGNPAAWTPSVGPARAACGQFRRTRGRCASCARPTRLSAARAPLHHMRLAVDGFVDMALMHCEALNFLCTKIASHAGFSDGSRSRLARCFSCDAKAPKHGFTGKASAVPTISAATQGTRLRERVRRAPSRRVRLAPTAGLFRRVAVGFGSGSFRVRSIVRIA